MTICLTQSLAKFGHVENMHFLNAPSCCMICRNIMAAAAMAIATFGSDVIPWFVKMAWFFCIRAQQSGCVSVTKS